MGTFGSLLVKDVYGNMNFQKDKAIEMPKMMTLEEYETFKSIEKNKIKNNIIDGS